MSPAVVILTFAVGVVLSYSSVVQLREAIKSQGWRLVFHYLAFIGYMAFSAFTLGLGMRFLKEYMTP